MASTRIIRGLLGVKREQAATAGASILLAAFSFFLLLSQGFSWSQLVKCVLWCWDYLCVYLLSCSACGTPQPPCQAGTALASPQPWLCRIILLCVSAGITLLGWGSCGGKRRPNRQINAAIPLPLVLTKCCGVPPVLTLISKRLNCHGLPWARERRYWDGCLGMKLKNKCIQKREERPAFKPSSCLEAAEQGGQGQGRSLSWEALVWERLEGSREGRQDWQQAQPGTANLPHHQEPGLAHIHS